MAMLLRILHLCKLSIFHTVACYDILQKHGVIVFIHRESFGSLDSKRYLLAKEICDIHWHFIDLS